MFDTHAHLQFEAFQGRVEETIMRAREAGVTYMMLPSTDVMSSRGAIEIAQAHETIYAAVGIHPHHIFKYQTQNSKVKSQNYKSKLKSDLEEIEKLINEKKVIAVGEVGLDKYYYRKSKYSDYEVTESFISLQKSVLIKHIKWALKYKKRLILHNREAAQDFLEVLHELWDSNLAGRTVFHCCEPNRELLDFARRNKIFIGVDGDVTYSSEKARFAKEIPLELLVLETDSPFLIPEPQRSQKVFPNTPANLPLIAKFIADLRGVSVDVIKRETTQNARELFGV